MPRMGEIYRVINKERENNSKKRFREDVNYFSIFVEDETGKNESTILLTDKELSSLRVAQFPENIFKELVLGRFYTIIVNNRIIRIIKLKKEDNTEYIVQMSNKLIKKAHYRADKHPESAPKKGWLQDLID